MWKYLCYAVGFIFGALMLFGGAITLNIMPSFFSGRIKSMLPIVNGSDAYDRYTGNNPVPLSVKLYMFNVTNPDEVKQGVKPRLLQVGPFVFSETRRRQVVRISPDNATIDSRLYRTYYFNTVESVPLNVTLTLPNAGAFGAFHGAAEKSRDEGQDTPNKIAGQYLANETIYLTHTANKWLFEGIKLDWLDGLNSDGLYFDDQPPDNTFGLYYKKNNTWDEKADGTVTVATGATGDISKIGQVIRWNNADKMSFWRGESCNSLRGTEGQFFHPFVQKDEKLDIFAPDLCRSLSIEFIKTTSLRTIELYRFGLDSSFFKPINYNNETKCFCVKRSEADKKKFCKLSGIMDASSCRKKPIVLSTPHFYNGDASIRDAFDGLSPSAAQHDTFVDVEPITGFVLRVRRRLQVNVEMIKYEDFEDSHRLEETRLIHPFIWLEQSVVIPDEKAQKLENKLTKTIRMITILCYVGMITGPIILIATLIFICRDIKSEDKKIRAAQKIDTGGDYQKVQVILKPLSGTNKDDQ